jgi:hypothetical protein
VNTGKISKYNKHTKCRHKGKSGTTLVPDKISQAASSTNGKQTVRVNQETSAMLISYSQSSPTDAALRIHSNVLGQNRVECDVKFQESVSITI